VSINVPNDKAKAVIDAMEREMMDKVATKSDVENLRLASKADLDHVRDILSKDIRALEVATKADLGHVSELLSRDIKALPTKTELAEFARSLTTQLYLAIGGSVVLTCTILGTLQTLR
jgi:hypothetical protein